MRATSIASCAGEFMLERRPVHLYEGERELLGLVVPSFQRPPVWEPARQALFIESLFLGLNSTAIVVTDNEWPTDGRRLPPDELDHRRPAAPDSPRRLPRQ